jgi:hypothetical protein
MERGKVSRAMLSFPERVSSVTLSTEKLPSSKTSDAIRRTAVGETHLRRKT